MPSELAEDDIQRIIRGVPHIAPAFFDPASINDVDMSWFRRLIDYAKDTFRKDSKPPGQKKGTTVIDRTKHHHDTTSSSVDDMKEMYPERFKDFFD